MAIITRALSNRSYLGDIFDDFMFPRLKTTDFGKMSCDIYEKDSVYYLEMDIPGFDKGDVNIEIDDNDYLIITAEKCNENTEEDEGKSYLCRERSYGKYQRSFYVGGIDKEKIEANFFNGILKVSMPKRLGEKSIRQKIEIK